MGSGEQNELEQAIEEYTAAQDKAYAVLDEQMRQAAITAQFRGPHPNPTDANALAIEHEIIAGRRPGRDEYVSIEDALDLLGDDPHGHNVKGKSWPHMLKYNIPLVDMYAMIPPAALISMWRRGRGLAGEELDGMHIKAIHSAWIGRFGGQPFWSEFGIEDANGLPVDIGIGDINQQSGVHAPVIGKSDLACILGISSTTVDRMIVDGRLPEPSRVGERRVCFSLHQAIDALRTYGCKARY